MDTLLIAVIFIIVLAILALFGLRHLQSKKGKSPKKPSLDKRLRVRKPEPNKPVTSNAITQALENIDTPEPNIPTTPAPEPTDTLAGVDAHLRNQNYDEAIGELKRILMINPHHNTAMLKLLQVYGITKRYAIFNQLHQKIQEIADPKTISEANFLKTLIDDEIASETASQAVPAPTPAPAQKPDSFGTLDFTLESPAQKPAPKSTPVDNFQHPTQPTHVTSPSDGLLSDELPDDDFDLLLDEPITLSEPMSQPKAPPPSPKPAPSQTAGNIFDLSNPRTFSNAVETQDDVFNFDLDLGQSKDIPNSQTTKPTPSESIDDFSFDFESSIKSDEIETVKPAPVTNELIIDFDVPTPSQDSHQIDTISIEPEPKQDEFEGFDFDFTTSSQPQSTPKQDEPAKADEFVFDGLLDPLDEPKPDDHSQAHSQKVADTSSDEQILSVDFQLEPTISTTSKPSIDDNDDIEFSFDDLSLELDDKQPPSPEPKMADNDLSLDFDDLSFDVATSQEPEPAPEPKARVLSVSVVPTEAEPEIYSREIPVIISTEPVIDVPEFTPSGDSSQVTLNLAKHYLKLGEYDAAKRLLDEVAQTGNDQQQQYAKDLLAKLG